MQVDSPFIITLFLLNNFYIPTACCRDFFNLMENIIAIEQLKGVGEKTAKLFNKLGIFTCKDLINNYPRAYDKYEYLTDIKNAKQNSRNAIFATVKSNPKIMRFNGKSILSFYITDGENSLEVRFFNAPYLLNAIKLNDKKVFRGFLRVFKDKLILDQPKMFSYEDYIKLQGTITPIYALTKDLSNDRFIKSEKQALEKVSYPKEYLFNEELQDNFLLNLEEAYKNIHFPADENALYKARRRIIFEEFLNFYRLSKEEASKESLLPNKLKMIEVSDCKRLEESLPYELTGAQKRAIKDIFADLGGEYLMNRLVQGDVGSGKTIVAIESLLCVAANGYQGAMMAPTEVLANQHFKTINEMSLKYNLCIKPVLLTGKMSAKDKRETLAKIKNGEANVIIGTHALISENVEYNKLALVITDEQHRFGVAQREAFRDKGITPHLLVMSATPIPRTLALILFAGLSISVIDEMPKNRIPISNCVVNSSFRKKIYEKIGEELKNGHQAYIICPMVSENEEDTLGLKSVEKHSKDIKEYFGDAVNVGTLNGKMKPDEKARIMEQFKNRNIDILVSTTVIEVGIDVPNATIILVENAERFGLSQLHQLRGRVGRGNAQSFCILLTDSDNEETLKRLKVLNDTNDGFKIANEDMRLRGPGELNGIRQSGELEFGLGSLNEDGDIMMAVSQMYEKISDRLPNVNENFIDFRSI